MNAPLKHPLPGTPLKGRANEAPSLLATLIAVEGAMLATGSQTELRHVTLAEVQKLVPCGLAAWVETRGRRVKIRAYSGLGKADRNTAFTQWLEKQIQRKRKDSAWDEPTLFALDDAEAFTPFGQALFAPFPDQSGGILLLADQEFHPTSPVSAARVAVMAQTCARARRTRPAKRRGWALPVLSLASLGALCLPVPMTTLAPAEIVPSDPFHITAPFDGVVEAITITPYAQVSEGESLIQLESTVFANEARISEREERLALARLRRSELSSFLDPTAKADMALARAEADLAGARKSYALENLARTELIAPRDGIAILTDIEDWIGKPVSAGQTILEVADPQRVEIRLDVPLSSDSDLARGTRVRLFLDSDPARPVEAELTRAAFRAEAQADGQMAFHARAEFDGERPETARIGARGVAKIYGGTAPLAWWLARKPITAARQILGL